MIAPDFTLLTSDGAEWSLSINPDHKPTMLVFYPFAFSPVCGGELTQLHDSIDCFHRLGLRVVGISCDPVHALREYASTLSLEGVPLLSDFWPHGEVSRAYDAFEDVRGHSKRTTVFITANGLIHSRVSSGVGEARDFAKTCEHAKAVAMQRG